MFQRACALTILLNFQDHVFNTIERASRIQFVHCMQSHRPDTNTSTTLDVLDVSYVRQQVRSYLLIDSIRTSNRGYPERLPFKDFRRRFQCLVSPQHQQSLNDALDDRSATQRILQNSDIYEHRYRLGLSQILLRTDVLIQLEERRDLCLSGLIVGLQFQCRRLLCSQWLKRRRIQEQAVRCLQRNINVHSKLRHWPWWKLYLNVLPLLNQARYLRISASTMLKHLDPMNRNVNGERSWSAWNNKTTISVRIPIAWKTNSVESLPSTVTFLFLDEMEQIYKAECQTTQYLTESLERETESRLQLEAELRALKQKQRRGRFHLIAPVFDTHSRLNCESG